MQNYSWYTNTSDYSPDSIHQILAFGSMSDIKKLFGDIGKDTVRQIFLDYSKKIYTKPTFLFVTHFLLHISQIDNENDYLKDTPRHIR